MGVRLCFHASHHAGELRFHLPGGNAVALNALGLEFRRHILGVVTVHVEDNLVKAGGVNSLSDIRRGLPRYRCATV